jgi:hypothetical protein
LSTALVIAALALAAAFGLHRLALWMESRGWIYYRRRGSSGSLGNAVLEVHAMLEPDRRHLVEVQQAEPTESAESAEPVLRR